MPAPRFAVHRRVALLITIVATLASLLGVHPGNAQSRRAVPEGMALYREPGVSVIHDPDQRDVAEHIAAQHHTIVDMLEQDWNLTTPENVTVSVFADAPAAREAGYRLSEFYAGVAYWPEMHIVMNGAAAGKRGWTAFDAVYLHEVVHLAAKYPNEGQIGGLPRWFDEGLAMHIAGSWDLIDDWSHVSQMLTPESVVPLRSLVGGFPSGQGAMRHAYNQSYQAFSFFVQRYGYGAVTDVLGNMREGRAFDQAFQRATGETFTSFESAWHASMRSWISRLLSFFGPGFAWMAMGVLAVAASIVHYRRRKAKQRYMEWQDQVEAMGFVDPSETIH